MRRVKSRKHRGRMPYSPSAGDGVIVNGYSEEWLKKGFPWVYRDEVMGRTGAMVAGRVVEIRSRGGEVLGAGLWEDEGKIEVRRFRTDGGPIDAELIGRRLQGALDARKLPPQTTAWRWVHGENDGLPGIRVDVWGSHLSISLDSPSLKTVLEPLIGELCKRWEVDAIWLSTRGVDASSHQKHGFGQIWGPAHSGQVEVLERGIRARVELGQGHDTGLFCDMRELRAWLEPHWRGQSVLNTFAHTGMFSVAAAVHGASRVVSVDLSSRYLEWARANFEMNSVDSAEHEFLAEDSFKALDRFRRKKELFDVVIADPPSFSRGPEGDWSSKGGLPRLVQACVSVVRDRGWLVMASNQGSMSPKDFHRAVQTGGRRAGCTLRILHQGSPPIDFPAALNFPESRYLKVWVMDVERGA
jgi:23S rRNA (cytosine1962-C5)-methyltransferase